MFEFTLSKEESPRPYLTNDDLQRITVLGRWFIVSFDSIYVKYGS